MRACPFKTVVAAAAMAAGAWGFSPAPAAADSRKRVTFGEVGNFRTLGGSSLVYGFGRYSYGLGSLRRPKPGSGGKLLSSTLASASRFQLYRRAYGPRTGLDVRVAPLRGPRTVYHTGLTKVAYYFSGRPIGHKPPSEDVTPVGAALAYLASITPEAQTSLAVTDAPIASLAPTGEGPYAEYMRKGEKAFRAGDYVAGFNNFKLANDLGGRDPESFLSLAHASFAMSTNSYARAAFFVAQALRYFPELPLVPLEPRGFWGDPKEYDSQLARLKRHVQQTPSDADGHFVLAYFQWFAGDADGARRSLSGTLAAAKRAATIEAVETFRDGMVPTDEDESDPAATAPAATAPAGP